MFGRNRRQCSICLSPGRKDVDTELREGASAVSIAQKYGFSKSAVHRHSLHVGEHNDIAERRILLAAERALRIAEKGGSHPAILASLKLLGELRRRSRIASPEQPHEGKSKNPDELIATLNAIYGLSGKGWEKQPEEREDERLIAMLRARVMRDDCDGKIAAACTLAASLISGRPLDRESKTEMRRLLEVADEVEIVGVVDDEVGEGIGTECDGSDDGDDEPAERSDNESE